MKTNTIIVILFSLIPFLAIFVIIDLREGTFPRKIIYYTLLGILFILLTRYLNKRSKRENKEKEQTNLQQ